MAKKTTKKKTTTRKKTKATSAQPSAAQIKRKVRSYIKEQKKPLLAQLKNLQKQRGQIDKEISAIEKTLAELGGSAAVKKTKRATKKKTSRKRRSSEQVEAVRDALVKKAGKTPQTASELLGKVKGAQVADLRALTAEGAIVSSGRGRGATYTAGK